MTDLLTARISPLELLLQLGCFRPAAVQRDYQWDEFRAERLLREITEAMLAANARTFPSSDSDERAEIEATPETEDRQPNEPEESELPGLSAHMSEAGAAPPKAISGFYIGVIVVSATEPNVYQIFDGLQRLTTLTILVSVLRDLIENADLKKRLQKSVVTGQSEFRLRHAGADTTLATMIQARRRPRA